MENNVTTQPQETEATAVETQATAKKNKPKFFTTGNMAVMGILTAISFVLYILPKLIPIFSLPFFPPWLEIQISDLPALLGGFAIGPWASVIIIVIKCLLKMLYPGATIVGEVADIIVGIAFTVPAAIIYQKNKGKKGAIVGMLVGMAAAIAMASLANWLVLIPFYAFTYGNGDAALGMERILYAVSKIYPNVTEEKFMGMYIFLGVIPFNLLRCIICGLITYFTYKPLSKALHWEIKSKKKATAQAEQAEDATVAMEAVQDTNTDGSVDQPTTSDEPSEN